jgi:hypothetical protein
MFDDAAVVSEEIVPEDKARNEVISARVNLYMAAKKVGYGHCGCQSPGKG